MTRPIEQVEPAARDMLTQLHGLASFGGSISDGALVVPYLLSIAVSLKRVADRLELCSDETNVPGGPSFGEFRVTDCRG